MFAELFKKTQSLATENSTALLTGVGVVGTVSTALLTGRASFKAAALIEDHERRYAIEHQKLSSDPVPDMEFREKLALVWPQFIPPVGVASITIFAIVMSNRVSAKEAAALATAYGVSERAFHEYREKVVERIGPGKETAVRDSIAQDRVNKTIESNAIVLIGSGTVLCMDLWTGRYFESTVEKIRTAENDINFEIVQGMYASASSFYDALGLEATEMTDVLGWNINNKLEVDFSTTLTTDGRPCLTISPTPPVANYNKLF